MRTKFYIWSLLCVVFFFGNSPKINAQEADFGISFGAYGGQTGYTDNQTSLMTRLFLRHEWTSRSFGEFNVGLGSVAGLEYKSRLIPLEYRYVFQLPDWGNEILGTLSPEVFIGIGALYNQPLEVARPNDPLTVEVGPRVGTSNYWKYRDGVYPVIPVGGSIDIELDSKTALQVGFHYNQSLSRSVTVTDDRMLQGYWGITFGVHFLKPKPKAPSRPVIRSFAAHVEEKATMKVLLPEANSMLNWARSEIERDTVFFDYFKAKVKSEQRDRVDRIAFLMMSYPQIDLMLEGHTDSRGFQWFNLPLSKERAWSVSKYIMTQGIEPGRLAHTGYGEARPHYDNSTEQGRAKNRRVTFATSVNDTPGDEGMDQRLASIPYDSTLFADPVLIPYESQSEDFKTEKDSTFDQIAVNMRRNRSLEIQVQGYPSSIGKQQSRVFWANRRAEVIRLELMKRGIAYERIHIEYIDLQELSKINEFDKAIIQQTD